VLNCEHSLTAQLQAAAFRILLQTVKPVSVDHLAARMDVPADITSGIEELQRSAHIRLDSNGCIVRHRGNQQRANDPPVVPASNRPLRVKCQQVAMTHLVVSYFEHGHPRSYWFKGVGHQYDWVLVSIF
jgi:hypothetical protein